MKNYWRGMNREGVAQYLVEKISKYNGNYNLLECAIGDHKASSRAYRHLMLCETLLIHQRLHGAVLTCQECGTRSENVEMIMDFHAAGTLCPTCLKRLTTHNC